MYTLGAIAAALCVYALWIKIILPVYEWCYDVYDRLAYYVLDDFVYDPIKAVCEWLWEIPARRREVKRRAALTSEERRMEDEATLDFLSVLAPMVEQAQRDSAEYNERVEAAK